MAIFIARVVLHASEKEEDYDKLHEDMEAVGYLRQIRGDSGRLWEMPSAMYVRKTASTATREQRRIEKAVESRWRGTYAIFVIGAGVSAWQGLDEIIELDDD